MVKKRPTRGVPLRRGDHPDIHSKNFCWRVTEIDWDGAWGWSRATGEELIKTIIPRLHDLETMTWGQVEGPTGCHFVEVTDIVPNAQRRLVEIGKDEQARLCSVRITGKIRVWGIRDTRTIPFVLLPKSIRSREEGVGSGPIREVARRARPFPHFASLSAGHERAHSTRTRKQGR